MGTATKEGLISALKKYGVPVVDMMGPGRGTLEARAITVHDTVTGRMNDQVAADFCKDGRTDVPGPLYNAVIGQEGQVFLLSLGRTNNTGKCNSDRCAQACKGKMPFERELPRPLPDDHVGANRSHYGIALRTAGAGPYSPKQIEILPKVLAAYVEASGWSPDGGAASLIGHGEITSRKTDPALDMGEIRRRTRATLRQESVPTRAAAASEMVVGAIRRKWESLGGESGQLGKPQTKEMPCPDGVGRYNHFDGGSIYWHPAIGAFSVVGDIRSAWARNRWEAGVAGYPTADERDCDGGREQDFQRGQVKWTSSTRDVLCTIRL